PFAQPLWKVCQHGALDFGQHLVDETVRSRALAVSTVADRAQPQVRWFAPTWSCLRPAGMPDQHRGAGEQRRHDIVGRAGGRLGCCGDPFSPFGGRTARSAVSAVDGDREICKGDTAMPKSKEIMPKAESTSRRRQAP